MKRADGCIKNVATKQTRITSERDKKIWEGWKALTNKRGAMDVDRFLTEISRHENDIFFTTVDQGTISKFCF